MTPRVETAGRISVREADETDASQWNAFVDACARGSFYHRFGWLRINRAEFGHEATGLIAEADDGRIVGVLPLVRLQSRIFGDILSSMPFVNLGGPAGVDPSVEDELVSVASDHADEIGCDYLEIRSDRTFGSLPSRDHKVSMTIDLPKDPDVLWDAFTSKHRKNVKRAYKNGIRVESGGLELLDPFFALMEEGWRALGTPLYRKSYFRRVLETFPEETRIFMAYHGRSPVATGLNGASDGAVEGMWAAGSSAHRDLQANYVLYWEMIQHACRAGFRRYHLGRSTAGSGAQRFKSRWMAEPKQLYWNYHLAGAENLPELNPENPRYDLAIRVWRRLPLFITRTIGPRIARSIP